MKTTLYRILLAAICIAVIFAAGCSQVDDIHQLYQITDHSDLTYDYSIKDRHGNILLSEEAVHREPDIKVLSENLLCISTQTGTGLSTRWTVYCDVEQGIVSDTFTYVLGEYEDNVIFVGYSNGVHSVIVQNIFDKDAYYHETILNDAFTAADPVIDFEIRDDGTAKIVYVNNSNHSETGTVIDLE